MEKKIIWTEGDFYNLDDNNCFLDIKKYNILPTKCMCHKGFSGYSSVVARSNFRVGGQETASQSLTAHTLDRYGAFKTTTIK